MCQEMNVEDSNRNDFSAVYFVTLTVVGWVDVFTRPKYKHIVMESLEYCKKNKGLVIHAWVLMSNHIHLIVSARKNEVLADILRDFKKHTSKRILAELEGDVKESRREWMMGLFRYAAANDNRIKNYRFWQEGYFPEILESSEFIQQKVDYVHNNPVRQEIVSQPEEYLYSSAVDYAGGKGLLKVEVLE